MSTSLTDNAVKIFIKVCSTIVRTNYDMQTPDFNKVLFWDIDMKDIDYEKHSRFIIERILMRGNWNDWQELKSFYGLQKIESEALNIRYLDKKTLNFCHTLFNIPKNKFKCYNTEPSIRKLWAY